MIEVKSIGLEEARKIIDAMLEYSTVTKPGRPMAHAVVDRAGVLVYLARMDGTSAIVQRMAENKAYTAVMWQRDTREISNLFKQGDVIPYRLPIRPGGSRYDVKAKSRYSNGQWKLMLYRKLDTGNDDDVSFNPLKRYSFAMAVFDNSGADHSKATQALVLTFDR